MIRQVYLVLDVIFVILIVAGLVLLVMAMSQGAPGPEQLAVDVQQADPSSADGATAPPDEAARANISDTNTGEASPDDASANASASDSNGEDIPPVTGPGLGLGTQDADASSLEDFVVDADAAGVDPAIRASAQELLSSMTLREKIYQMFVVYPDALTGVEGVTMAGETSRAALADMPVGGLIYDSANISSVRQFTAMVDGEQSFVRIPLLTCLDEEGGRVTRLGSRREHPVNAMFSYKDEGVETAYSNAVSICTDLVTFHINTDLAPVADVLSQPDNTVIGDRAYSDDYVQTAALIASAVDAFKDCNILCTLKHFPGHGSTLEDSHEQLSYVYKTKETLLNEDLLPFISGIQHGADMVMTGHLIVPEIDNVAPATFSHKLVTELLREELGFQGVVITDALSMSGATAYVTGSEACIQAIEAGCDLLLDPDDLAACALDIEAAVASGRLTEERINESVERILIVKMEHQLI